MAAAKRKNTFSARMYNAVTALVANFRAIRNPMGAARYRSSREAYRTYVAGMTTGPNQNYRPKSRSADAETKRSMTTIVGRCRDQVQNNPNISGAIKRIVNNAVRNGIRPQFRFRDKDGKLDRKTNRAWETLFGRWARYADITGHDSYWAQQRLGLRHMWSDGGFFIHRVWDDSIPGIVPLRLEFLERDHLDTTKDGVLSNGNTVRQGKELDSTTGKPVAYWLFPNHPGDYQYYAIAQDSIRIPAEDIIDVYERERISQNHAIPWIVSIVMEAFDLEDYRSFERIGAKLAAAFGVFVKSNYPDLGSPGIGIQRGANQEGDSGAWPTSWEDVPDFIEPGRIQSLPYGTDISIASHNRPGNQYEPYVKESRRTQSVGTGMSYEAYANDYSDASYSSTRTGSLEERLSYGGMQFFINEKVNDRVAAWFIEAAWLSALNPVPMKDFRFNPWPYLEAVGHQNPGWTWQDPQKDGNAAKIKINDTFSSNYRRVASEQGQDFDEVLAEAIDCENEITPLLELRAYNQKILNGDDSATPSAQ